MSTSTLYQILLDYPKKHITYTNIISIDNIMKRSDLFDDYSEINEKRYLNNSSIDKICPITLNQFSEGDYIIELPCKHCFSKYSILKWLFQKSHTCPVCRRHINLRLSLICES